MSMQMHASNKSAFVTGICSGAIMTVLGPFIDGGGAVLLILAVLAVAGPAYFFVFGVSREEMVGFWAFRPDLLKRIALWLLANGCVLASAQFLVIGYQRIAA